MSFIDLTPPPTLRDRAWQTAYRLGFPIAKAWWRVRQQKHVGALVAVYVNDGLLLVRSPYRQEWNFPGGGVRSGETPSQAARRELLEEIGLTVAVLGLARVITGLWEGYLDQVHVFQLRLDRAPTLRLDNREIVGVRFMGPGELDDLPLTGPVAAYLRDERAVPPRL